MKKVVVRKDKCLEIDKSEGLLKKLETPEVDVSDWRSALLSLHRLGRNIIVEHESLNQEEGRFAIGKIEKVGKKKLWLRHFDGDGVWEEECRKIPYSEITSVTFGSRYVEVFSKYLPPLSE